MKKNDVLRKGDLRLRILMIRDACCLVINCDGKSMPFWLSADELAGCTDDPPPAFNTTMTQHQKQLAHERFTLIAPMLTFLTDDTRTNISKAAAALLHTTQTMSAIYGSGPKTVSKSSVLSKPCTPERR